MKSFKNLLRWGKDYWWLLVGIILINSILQALYSYLPLFVQFCFKLLGGEETKVNLPIFLLNFFNKSNSVLSIILRVCLAMIILQFVRSILRLVCSYSSGLLTQNISKDMRIKLYNHIGDLSYSYHNNCDTGDLIQRSTSDIDTSCGFIASNIPQLFNIVVTISMGAYQVYKINSTLMWVSLIICPITAISSTIYFRYCNKSFEKIEQAESEMTTIIQENVNNARVVRAFANEKYEFEKMDKANEKFAKKDMGFTRVMAIYWGISDCSVMLQYVITISTAVLLAKSGKVDIGDITACLLLMGMLVWPMRGLGRIISNMGRAIVASNRIQEVLDEPSEFLVNGTLKPKITGNIEFKDVKFKFKDDSKSLLNGITFDIKAGEMVAIVGKTGSGKSTICNILTRMIEYDSGHIYVDGVELKDIDKKYLRTNVKIVLQDPFLFSKTVYENISITDKNISEDKIFQAAKLASIHEEVLSFEKGYKTLVGEKGTTLSGGQKQRVAIARVLVDDAPVIIFDDSLSALDTKTDLMIRNALKNKQKKQTMIVITHRTTTAKEADKIVVLDNGVVSEIGTHDQLVKIDGLYKDLWGIQGELEQEFNKVMNGDEK